MLAHSMFFSLTPMRFFPAFLYISNSDQLFINFVRDKVFIGRISVNLSNLPSDYEIEKYYPVHGIHGDALDAAVSLRLKCLLHSPPSV